MVFVIENLSQKIAKAEKQYLKASKEYENAIRSNMDKKTQNKIKNKLITARIGYNFYKNHGVS